jgi:hypothetical protein
METIPSPRAVRTLLDRSAESDLDGASIVKALIRPRPTFNGRGYDVAWDLCVLWFRDDLNGGGSHGVHSGTVRAGADGARANLYGGHYDLERAGAEDILSDLTGGRAFLAIQAAR